MSSDGTRGTQLDSHVLHYSWSVPQGFIARYYTAEYWNVISQPRGEVGPMDCLTSLPRGKRGGC